MRHLAQILIVVYLNFTLQIQLLMVPTSVVTYVRSWLRAVLQLQMRDILSSISKKSRDKVTPPNKAPGTWRVGALEPSLRQVFPLAAK